MDLVTAAAVVVNQSQSTQNSLSYIITQSYEIQSLAQEENSIPEINPQIKAIIASLDANMEGLRSQTVLLQQAIDVIAEIVK